MDGKQPNVLDQTNTDSNLSDKFIKFIQDLRGAIQRDDDDRQQWKNKMIVAQNQRQGVKRYTAYPYPGAPDIPLPETDKLIKKSTPTLVLSSWAPKKMCTVKVRQGVQETPELKEKSKKAEAAMNSLLRSREVGWFKKLCLAADYMKQHGHCIFRVIEDFRSRTVTKTIDLNNYSPEEVQALKQIGKDELRQIIADKFMLSVDDEDDVAAIDDAIEQFKSGADEIDLTYEEIMSLPNVDVPLPTKVIVPSYVTDINKSPRITYEYFLTRPEIETRMRKGIFRKKDLDTLKMQGEDKDLVESVKQRNEGVQDNSGAQDLYRIHECLTYYREKDSDELQRWVFTFLADSSAPEDSLLQDMQFPFAFDGTNYEKCDNELKDARYYNSRGLPEQVRALQEVLERCINNMIIRDEMNNTPMWEVLETSQILDTAIRFVPGAKLPVKQIGAEIGQIGQVSSHDSSSDRLMALLKGYTEEYMSSNDYLFRNSTNAGGGKTLGEVQQGIQQNSGPLNLEVINWNETLSNVYQKMYEVLKDRVGDSMWIDGVEITRDDLDFPAEVRSNGDLEVADQNMSTQKAIVRLQTIVNPAFGECVTAEDKYNALVDWLEKDGVKDPDTFVTNPIEVAQQQITQLQGQLQQMQAQMGKMQEEQKTAAQRTKSLKSQAVEAQGDLEAVQQGALEGMMFGAT